MRKFLLLLAACVVTGTAANGQEIVAEWNFEDEDKRTATDWTDTFYTADDGDVLHADIAEIRLEGPSFAGWVLGSEGSGSSAPNSNGWDGGAGTRYWQITLNTTGRSNLTLSSVQRGSNTGPRDFRVDYSLDGSVWSAVPNAEITVANNFTSGVLEDVPLPEPVEDQAEVFLRWVMTSETSVNEGTVGSSGTNRIDEIVVREDAPLPVQLAAFDAAASGRDVMLSWRTASETNNAGFHIQRRSGEGFADVGFVEGRGTDPQGQAYSFQIADLAPGTHAFRLRQIDFDGATSFSRVLEVTVEIADAYELTSAYPNPFNPQTSFRLTVAQEQRVTVEVFDVLGRQVATLHDGLVPANETQTFTFTFSAGSLSSGLYLYRVAGETFADTRRVTLLK